MGLHIRGSLCSNLSLAAVPKGILNLNSRWKSVLLLILLSPLHPYPHFSFVYEFTVAITFAIRAWYLRLND